jgi:hypothetical protein
MCRRRLKTEFAAGAFVLVIAAPGARAQEKPDSSGVWVDAWTGWYKQRFPIAKCSPM